jgi:hypothetical protein
LTAGLTASGGKGVVVAFRVYFLDGVNRFIGAENIEAETADAAVRQARAMRGDSINCEVWCGSRLVARVIPDESDQ